MISTESGERRRLTLLPTWISVLASFHPVSAGYVLSALVNALIEVKIPQVGE